MLPLSQFLLLQTASPDAIIRLESTALEDKNEIRKIYFEKLHHQSIEEFLTNQLQQCDTKGGLLIQVIFFGIACVFRVFHSLVLLILTILDHNSQPSVDIQRTRASQHSHWYETGELLTA